MPRIDDDEWPDESVSRVYLAGKLSEAQKVEQVLDLTDIQYSVRPEEYRTALSILFGPYDGIAFYVHNSESKRSIEELRKAKLLSGLTKDEPGA